MAYKSEAQRKKFHAMASEGKLDKKTVEEWDEASKGMQLPERVEPKAQEKKHENKMPSIKSIADIERVYKEKFGKPQKMNQLPKLKGIGKKV